MVWRPRCGPASTRHLALLGHRPTLKLGGILSNISHDLGAELLAVLREAMTNAAKHAQATRTEVSLDVGTDAVVLIVSDDGIGMSPKNAADAGGLGLRNIQERQTQLAGKHCSSRDGAGDRDSLDRATSRGLSQLDLDRTAKTAARLGHSQFHQDRRHVVLDGFLRTIDPGGDLAVGEAFGDVVEDRPFELGECCQPGISVVCGCLRSVEQ